MRTKLCPTPPPYLEEPVATYLHIVKTEHVCNRKRTYCNRNSKPSCLISSCLLPFLEWICPAQSFGTSSASVKSDL
jgi:hypothetical protein